MPLVLRLARSRSGKQPTRNRVAAISATGVLVFAQACFAGDLPTVMAVRSRQAALHYRLLDADQNTAIALWYTRDRGATWLKAGLHRQHGQPIVFNAPAEGLYGFTLIPEMVGQSPVPPPQPNQRPQRWVFVDYTPPLLQWDGVEPAEAFSARRLVHLRWTAHDDHFPSRPIQIWYQSSIDQVWHRIESDLANVGRYDWKVPPEVAGQITLKLIARDLGGHVIERPFGPVAMDRWVTTGIPPKLATPTTRPAADDPKGSPPTPKRPFQPPSADVRRAEELHELARRHLRNRDFDFASARLREALTLKPEMLPAMNDLACLHHAQQQYGKAAELYEDILARDAGNVSALRGAQNAYLAQRQYDKARETLERLLTVNANDAQANLDLGDVLFMMGDLKSAREYWDRARSVDPSATELIKRASGRLADYTDPTLSPGRQASARQK